MKQALLFLMLFSMCAFSLKAQLKTKRLEIDSGRLEIVYFPSGKVSTRTLTPSYEMRFGYAKAFDIKGNMIFSGSVSRVGGHGGVSFTYHPNGYIKTAHSTFQPDGGIQRHDVTRYYDETGTFIREEDMSYPYKLHTEPLTQPYVKPTVPTPKPSEPKQEEMRCADIAQMRAYIENTTDKILQVRCIPNNKTQKPSLLTIKPGERIFCAEYIMAQLIVPPGTYYVFEPVNFPKGIKLGPWIMEKKSESSAWYMAKLISE